MRPADWPQKMALAYSGPPDMAAGTAQASPMAAPRSTETSTPAYQRGQPGPGAAAPEGPIRRGAHSGASRAAGSTWTRMAGPLASTPRPMATPVTMNPRQPARCRAVIRPPMPSSAKKARSGSKKVRVENSVQNRLPSTITGARRATSGRSGHRRRARLRVRNRQPRPNSGATSRGHHSLTPVTAHPACISQNSSGGLWL